MNEKQAKCLNKSDFKIFSNTIQANFRLNITLVFKLTWAYLPKMKIAETAINLYSDNQGMTEKSLNYQHTSR